MTEPRNDSRVRVWMQRNDPWVRVPIFGVVGLTATAFAKFLFGVLPNVDWNLFATAGVAVAGVLALVVLWTPTATQSRLLTEIEQERRKLRYYESLVDEDSDDGFDEQGGGDTGPSTAGSDDDTDSPNGADTDEPGSGDETPAGESSVALGYRCTMADEALDAATEAVFRRDYAKALHLSYEASRHNLVLSTVLDVHEISGSQRCGPDSDGETESGATGCAISERTENLVARVRTFAERMDPSESDLVGQYLDGPSVSPFDLYYALEVMHEWNVRQRKNVYNKKRYFRLAILLLLLFGVGLTVLSFVSDDILNNIVETDAGVDSGPLVGLVMLVGGVGALFSVLRSASESLGERGTDPSVPDAAFVYEALVLRVLVGSIGALLIAVLIQTSAAETILNTEFILDTGDSGNPNLRNLVVLAFVSGFSEQLVKTSLDRFVDTTLDTGESGSGDSSGDGEPSGPDSGGGDGSDGESGESGSDGESGESSPDDPGEAD